MHICLSSLAGLQEFSVLQKQQSYLNEIPLPIPQIIIRTDKISIKLWGTMQPAWWQPGNQLAENVTALPQTFYVFVTHQHRDHVEGKQ